MGVHLPVRRCMSSNRSVADLCAFEPTLMIWERTRSKSRLVRANGPSRLVPNVISKPSTVSWRCSHSTPALLIRMSTSPPSSPGNARTDDRSARSSSSTWVDPPISAARVAPRSVLRTAMMTRAPALASACAVPSPTPLVAPVTMIRLSLRSPSRLGDHCVTATTLDGFCCPNCAQMLCGIPQVGVRHDSDFLMRL